jgi:antitoxin VapB
MEHNSVEPNTKGDRRAGRAASACDRLRAYLEASGRPGVVLTTCPAVAWATGGLAPPVDRTAATEVAWLVLTARAGALITSEVEAARLIDEYDPRAHGLDLVVVPWFEPEAFARAAGDAADAPVGELAADGHPAFGIDASDDLTALRLALGGDEQHELRQLGRLAAEALRGALVAWRPGDRDLDVQAALVATVEAGGGDTPVVIVGGDERVRRFRHPVAVGAPMHELVMAVVVARRAGLHAAATRFASARPLDGEATARWRRAEAIDDAVLAATRPGATYGAALGALDRAYAKAGAPGAWREHFQGGPIGFRQREFEIAPVQRDSRWFAEPIAAGHAVAWNPSLGGGAKIEDTYLVGADGLERVTDDGSWPTRTSATGRRRPVPLVVGA